MLTAILSSTTGCRTPARLGSLPGLGWLGNKDGQAAALASEDPTAAYPPPSAASVPSPLTNNVATTDGPSTDKQAGLAAPESYPNTGFPSVELPAAGSAAPARLSGSAGSMAATSETATGGGLTAPATPTTPTTPPAGTAEAFPSYPPAQTANTGAQPQQGFYGSPGRGAVPGGTLPSTPPPAGNALATADAPPSSHPYPPPTGSAPGVGGANLNPAFGAAPNSQPVGGPWPSPSPSTTAPGGYGAAPANLTANLNAVPNSGTAIGGYPQSAGFAAGSTPPSAQVSHEQPIVPNGPLATNLGTSFPTATSMAQNPWRPGSTSDYEAAATVANTAQAGFPTHVPGTAQGAYGEFPGSPPAAAPAAETDNRASVWR